MKFLAVLAGGIGPDVWDKEMEIDAADFADAARMANGRAEEAGGAVILLEQWDWPQETDTKRLDAIAKLGIEIVPRKGLWNCLLADNSFSQRGVSADTDLRRAIDAAVKEFAETGETSYHIQ